tara:strand:- start:29 stop:763 length:735 start_codon:yes stop_codon:yes gene_type:complete
MMSEKIQFEFMSPLPGLTLVEECRIQPSINYIPDSWKKLPQAVDMPLEDINPYNIGKYYGSGVPSTTAKGCPSFIDIFQDGFVYPAPCDLYFYFDKESKESRWEAALDDITIRSHGDEQYVDHVPKSGFQHVFKLDYVWCGFTPPGYSVRQIPMLWHHNPYFEVAYGVIHTDLYHQINPQIMMREGIKEFQIKQGEPLCYLVPYKRQDYELKFSDWDLNRVNAANIRAIGKFKKPYLSMFKKNK